MKDEIYQRELGWMELVARAFSIFFQNIKGILFVMLVVFLPVSLLDSIIVVRLNAINSFLSTVQTAGTYLENREAITQAMNHTIVGTVLSMAISLFLVPVGTIAVAKLVKQGIDGAEPDIKAALREALALEPAIIVSGLISGVLITLGCCLFIIPGIWLSGLFVLYEYSIGLGGRSGSASLMHSKELVEGRWWRTFGYMFAVGCIASLWDLLIAAVFTFIEIASGTHFIMVLLQDFLGYFSGSFAFVSMALLFLNRESQRLGWQDLGEKKEADIEMMA